MKKLLCFVLTLLCITPPVMLRPAAEVYSGKALDVEYILSDKGDITYPDEEMTEEELEEWLKQQEELNKGNEDILNSEAAMKMAPGYRIQYEVDTTTGKLRIYCAPPEGNTEIVPQEMLSYAKRRWIPWQRDNIYRKITEARVEEGVLSVGHYAFSSCKNLKTVYLPHSTTKVERMAFYMCENLETIYYAGTEEDFKNNVLWMDFYNTLDRDGTVFAKDKLHFGEHVTVECVNQEGKVFDSYTVGGYNVGDAYTVSAKTYGGMELTGTGSFSGSFKRKDGTVYTFTYNCKHEYAVIDADTPCSSKCIHCGKNDPDAVGHTFYEQVLSERSFTHDGETYRLCTLCGAEDTTKEYAYFWYVVIGGGVLLVFGGLAALISHPIRKRKKLKDLTW